MAEEPLSIAVILPAWQVAPWLPETLAALEAQTFSGWTCLAVDDGSCDATGSLLDEAARRDGRYRVIHQPNGGVSAARNRALDALRLLPPAAGRRYIAFLDGDDVPLPGWFAHFVRTAEESGAQLIRQGFRTWRDGTVRPSAETDEPSFWSWLKRPGVPWDRRASERMEVFTHCMALWPNLCDSSLLPYLRCPVGIRVGEDLAAVFGMLCHTDSVAVSRYDGFLYRLRPGSASQGGLFRGHPAEMLKVMAASLRACEASGKGRWFERGFLRLVAAGLWPVLVASAHRVPPAEYARLRGCLKAFFSTRLGKRLPPPRWHYGPACLMVRRFGVCWPLRLTRCGGTLRCWLQGLLGRASRPQGRG